jgi:hypothetical protein
MYKDGTLYTIISGRQENLKIQVNNHRESRFHCGVKHIFDQLL